MKSNGFITFWEHYNKGDADSVDTCFITFHYREFIMINHWQFDNNKYHSFK